ncbi:MAG: PAS domain S-box protein [Gemmatimonadota bacterium]
MSTPANDRERFALVDRMTALFASGPDEETLLRDVVDLFVPDYASWASIDVLDRGKMMRVAVASVDLPGHDGTPWESELAPANLFGGSDQALNASDAPRVLHIESAAELPPLPAGASSRHFLDLLPLSVILAPLRANGERLGTLVVLAARRERRYTDADLTVVGGVAQRTAFAIINGRLVARLQRELEARAEMIARLRESESRFRQLFAVSPIAMPVHDAVSRRIVAANAAALAQYGWSEDELLRMTVGDLEPPEGSTDEIRALRAHFAMTDPDGVTLHWRKDGARLLVEVRSHDLEIGGRRAIVTQALDVTDRVRAFGVLRASEERHRLVARATKEALWEWHSRTGELEWNDAFSDLFRFAPGEATQSPDWLLSRIHPDDRLAATAVLSEAIRSRREECVRRFRFKRGDGSEALVDDRIVIAYDVDGPVRVIGSLTDITAQQKQEEQLALAQRLEAIGRLAGGVAHDFNNVLTAIHGFATFALDEQPSASQSREDLGEILQAIDRAATLTRHLLAFSRRQVLQPQLVDVNEHLRRLHNMLGRVLGEDVELQTFLAPRLPLVLVDPGQFEQVILNLVVNARDAMPDGGLLTIETSSIVSEPDHATPSELSEGEYVVIAVTDTGTGMEAHTLERIFEPFFSTKDRDKGTGLGLATSYGIIEQSGGHISVYSELGRGSTFRILLPRAVDDEVIAAPVIADGPTSLAGHETLLLVEDDERVRRVSVTALKRHGYSVMEARTAEAALATFREEVHAIDAVVTDIVLPRMNGAQLARELRSIRPELPILFVSGFTENAFTRAGDVQPGIDLLEKPFAPEALVRRVRDGAGLPARPVYARLPDAEVNRRAAAAAAEA